MPAIPIRLPPTPWGGGLPAPRVPPGALTGAMDRLLAGARSPVGKPGAAMLAWAGITAFDVVGSRASALIAFHMRGLVKYNTCSTGPWVTWSGPGAQNGCLSNQLGLASRSFWQMAISVRTAIEGTYFNIYGIQGLATPTIPYWKTLENWQVVGARPRPGPFYAPVAPAIPVPAPMDVAPAYPPGFVPWYVTPAPYRPGVTPGVEAGNAPPWAGDKPTFGPPIAWEIAPPRVRPITIPIVRAPPKPGEREVKFGANTLAGQMLFGLFRAIEAKQEVKDFIESLFRALPRDVQKRFGGNKASEFSMLTAISMNVDKIDGKLWLRNMVANQVEDEIIGRTYMKARSYLRNFILRDAMGNPVPLSNDPVFKAYAKKVSMEVSDFIDFLFGYKPGDRYKQGG